MATTTENQELRAAAAALGGRVINCGWDFPTPVPGGAANFVLTELSRTPANHRVRASGWEAEYRDTVAKTELSVCAHHYRNGRPALDLLVDHVYQTRGWYKDEEFFCTSVILAPDWVSPDGKKQKAGVIAHGRLHQHSVDFTFSMAGNQVGKLRKISNHILASDQLKEMVADECQRAVEVMLDFARNASLNAFPFAQVPELCAPVQMARDMCQTPSPPAGRTVARQQGKQYEFSI